MHIKEIKYHPPHKRIFRYAIQEEFSDMQLKGMNREKDSFQGSPNSTEGANAVVSFAASLAIKR